MAKIIDRRNISLGGHSKRAVSAIKNIAVHYSATPTGSSSSFENHWKNTNGWSTGGYHEVVLLNGNVELNYGPNVISNGVGGQNTRMYNICYVGAGQPNAAQLKTLKERANYNRNRFGLSVNAVKGHREYPGQSTACPGLNMTTFRNSLSGGPSSGQSQSNKAIEQLQKDLKSLGYDPGKIDGIDGTTTQNAVRAFQRAEGLTVDGIAGKITKAEIKRIKNGGLTMSEAKKLQTQIDALKKENAQLKQQIKSKFNTPSGYNSEKPNWGEDLWKQVSETENYFDGKRPNQFTTRLENAALIKRIVANIKDWLIAPLEKRIKKLEDKE